MLWFHYDPIGTNPVDTAAVQTLEQLVASDPAVRQAAYAQLQTPTAAQQYATKFLLQQLLRRLTVLPAGAPSANPDHLVTLAEIGAVYACSYTLAHNPNIGKIAQLLGPVVDVDFTQEGAQTPPEEVSQRWQMLQLALARVNQQLDPWLSERVAILRAALRSSPVPSAAQIADVAVVVRQIAEYNLKANDLGTWVFLHDLLVLARGRSQGTVGRNARMPAKPGTPGVPVPVLDMALVQLQLAVQAHIVLWLVSYPDHAGSYSELESAIAQQRQAIRHELQAQLATICHQIEDTQAHVWLRDKPTRNPLLDNIGEPCFPTRTPVSVFASTYQRTQPSGAEEAAFLSQCLSACLKAGYEPGVLALLKLIAEAPVGSDWLDLDAQLAHLHANLQQTIAACANSQLAFDESDEVEFELVAAGNRYQVGIRRAGLNIRLRTLAEFTQRAIDQRSALA